MHDCFTPSMKVTYPEYAIMFKYSTEEIMRNEENSTAIVKFFFLNHLLNHFTRERNSLHGRYITYYTLCSIKSINVL